ncbi:MAG TPA: ABC transporter substrate-binding protein [Oculatellaceae cyanobacterium]|jgi:branched-chain amino acid transport system substrate-binding protein
MENQLVLEIAERSIAEGFPATLRISEDGKEILRQGCIIPSAERLFQEQEKWCNAYYDLATIRNARISRITIYDDQVTNVSIEDAESQLTDDERWQRYQIATRNFKEQMQEWLEQPEFLKLQIQVANNLNGYQTARMIIATKNRRLWKLPWHLWSLFRNFRNDPAISNQDYVNPRVTPLSNPKILAIFGNDTDINLQPDRELLASLEKLGAKITWLEKPTRQQLRGNLSEQAWDILFFAGHSYSDEHGSSGVIELNKSDRIYLWELKHRFKEAVNNGLKLAIFNSCLGLGIAQALSEVNLPHIIVMREPVPDQVAERFLEYFLKFFSQGKSLNESVREARHRLQEDEIDYQLPCASWLPVVYENPTVPPLVWIQPEPISTPPPPPDLDPIPTPPPPPDPIWIIWLNNWSRMPKNTKLAIALFTLLFISIILILIFPPVKPPKTNEQANQNTSVSGAYESIGDRISLGDKLLIKDKKTLAKVAGVAAFKQQNYQFALANFAASLKESPNDPESLIYKNNAQAQSQNSLKIAAVVPISTNLNFAQEMLRGVAMAQNKINQQGGINNRLLQVAIIDDSNNPNIAKQVAEQLVADHTILAVVGHNASFASLAAAPIYQKGRLVMISPTSFANEFSGFGDYIFRTIPRIRNLTEPLAEYVVKTVNKTQTAICYDYKSPDQKVFKEEYVESLKSKGVKTKEIPCDFSSPTFDPNQVINEAVSSGADSLLLAPSVAPTNTINKAMEVAKANQVAGLTLFGSTTLYTNEALKSGGSNVNGLVLATPWSPKDSSPQAQNFAKEARQLWKADVNWRTATDYDATLAIITGLQKKPTRAGLKNELRRKEFVALGGANGDIKFAPTGDPLSNNIILLKVRPSRSNPTGYDFIPIQP